MAVRLMHQTQDHVVIYPGSDSSTTTVTTSAISVSFPRMNALAAIVFIREHLPREDWELFTRELDVLLGRVTLGDFAVLREFIESWEATAEVYSDSDLRREVDESMTQLRKRWGNWQDSY